MKRNKYSKTRKHLKKRKSYRRRGGTHSLPDCDKIGNTINELLYRLKSLNENFIQSAMNNSINMNEKDLTAKFDQLVNEFENLKHTFNSENFYLNCPSQSINYDELARLIRASGKTIYYPMNGATS